MQSLDNIPHPFQIPKSWEWTLAGNLFQDIRYGTSRKCAYEKTKFPVLRIPNVAKGTVILEDLKYTTLTEKEAADLSLKKNNILIIRSNGSTNLVGRSAIVPAKANGYAYAGYLMRLRLPDDAILAEYFHLVFESNLVREQIEKPIRTTSGVKNINSTEISNLVVPIPPEPEQHRIVAKVDELMALCDQLEVNINNKSETASRYAEAIVHQIAAA